MFPERKALKSKYENAKREEGGESIKGQVDQNRTSNMPK